MKNNVVMEQVQNNSPNLKKIATMLETSLAFLCNSKQAKNIS